jgi:hypothetical protein
MKSHANHSALCAAFATFAALAFTLTTARAADGAWAFDAAGSWDDPASWTLQAIPGGIGAVITFPASSADRVTTLDSPFTIGKLVVDISNKKWTIDPGTGGSITFDNGAAKPELFLDVQSGNGNRLYLNASLHGTNGVLLYTQSGKKPFIELHGAGTISGEFILSNSLSCVVYNSDAFGAAAIKPATAVVLDLNQGLTITNDIILAGGSVYSTNPQGVANPNPVTLAGKIISEGGGTLFAGHEGRAPALIINAPITGVGSVAFRGGIDKTPIYINAPAKVENGKLGVLTGVMLHVNAPLAWDETQAFNLQGGTILCNAENVFDTTAAIEFSSYENSEQILNLNGFDQRIGGIINGAWNSMPSVISLITSATPATLTLDIAQNQTRNMRYRFRIDGDFDILKKGLGTQQLNNPISTNLVSRWIVEEGNLQFNAGLFSANALINGGALSGAGTLLFRIDRDAPDAMLLESGAINIANMPVMFEGASPDYGEYLILDATAASAPNATFTASTSATAPFLSISGLPADCRLKRSPDRKKVWLVRPHPGTMLLIK